MDRRRRCCQILSNALYKMGTKHTFDMINAYQRNLLKEQGKAKGSNRMYRLWRKFRLKAALAQWRDYEYNNICIMQTSTFGE